MKGGAQRRRSAVSCAQNAAAIPGNVPSAAESFPGIIHFPSVSAVLSGAVHCRSALVFTISGITIKTHTTGSATMIPQYLKSIRQKEGGNDFSSQFDHAGAYGSHMIAHALKAVSQDRNSSRSKINRC